MGMTYHQAILALIEGKPITHPGWASTGPGDPLMFVEKRPNGLFLRLEGEPEAEMEDDPFKIGHPDDTALSPDWLIYEPAPEPEAEWPKYELHHNADCSEALRVYFDSCIHVCVEQGESDVSLGDVEIGGLHTRLISRKEAIQWINEKAL